MSLVSLLAALLAVGVRFVALTLPTRLLDLTRQLPSQARALSLPAALLPKVFVPITFAVALFSAVARGLRL